MMNIIERARELRRVIEANAQAMTDEAALETPELYPEWDGNSVAMTEGDRVRRNGVLYKALVNHNTQPEWPPENAPSLYAKVLTDPSGAILPWEQPDSTNTYSKGDKVTHNGKTWVSEYDNNSWEPGVFGWTEVEG